jgi:hypothetical protein
MFNATICRREKSTDPFALLANQIESNMGQLNGETITQVVYFVEFINFFLQKP